MKNTRIKMQISWELASRFIELTQNEGVKPSEALRKILAQAREWKTTNPIAR